MIQDIYPKKLHNEYDTNAVIEKNDYVISIKENKILIRITESNEVEFPRAAELGVDLEYTYLFSVDDERFFMLCKPAEEVDLKSANVDAVNAKGSKEKEKTEVTDVSENVKTLAKLDKPEISKTEQNEYLYEEIRELREHCMGPKYKMMVIYTAKHLSDWYRDTKFCGRCGGAMKHSERERAMTCTKCGYTAYPRIMPAVIVGVINGDKMLLTKYRRGYAHFALIAGFTEIGETVEETVAREVMEEAGIRVKNIRYYKSQPWGSANDILLGFYCEADGDSDIHMDDNELKFAQWVDREDIELQPDDFSLTNEMMMQFKNGAVL